MSEQLPRDRAYKPTETPFNYAEEMLVSNEYLDIYLPNFTLGKFEEAAQTILQITQDTGEKIESWLQKTMDAGRPPQRLIYPQLTDDLSKIGWFKPRFEFGRFVELSKANKKLRSPGYKYKIGPGDYTLVYKMPKLLESQRMPKDALEHDIRFNLPIAHMRQISKFLLRNLPKRASEQGPNLWRVNDSNEHKPDVYYYIWRVESNKS